MSEESLSLLRQAQRLASRQALDAVERDKAAQIGVEATPQGVEATISATVGQTPAALRWFAGGRVTGFVSRSWDGVKSWGGRFTKKL